ncbi:MAG: hypothetical protein U0798_10640 [Gemmataceae bacterium]
MRTGIITTLAIVLLGQATGCQTPRNAAMSVPIREDYVAPPDEKRYNQPPESAYRAPPPKKEWGSRPGQNGQPSGMGALGQ